MAPITKNKSGRSRPISKYRGNPSSGSRADDNTCAQTDGQREEHDEAKRRFSQLKQKHLKKKKAVPASLGNAYRV
jgi:hypothetical protein